MPEGLGRLLRHDDVDPGGAVLDQHKRRKQTAEEAANIVEGGDEDVGDDGSHDAQEGGAKGTAEVGHEPAVGEEPAVDDAEGRGGPAAADAGEFPAAWSRLFRAIFVGIYLFIQRWVLVLNDGEDWVDPFQGVTALQMGGLVLGVLG